MQTIDRVLSKSRVSQADMSAALREAYLMQFDDVDDDVTDIYIGVWDRICERTDKATARDMFRAILKSLPAKYGSDVDCDGEDI